MIKIKIIMSIVFLFSFPVLSKTNHKCKNGEHWVESHHRSTYVRYDGVEVKAAYVNGIV